MQTEKQRERLVELLNEATFGVNVHTLADHLSKDTIERVADYLLANGVTVLPIKVGDTIYIPLRWSKDIISFNIVKIEILEGKILIIGEYGEELEIESLGKTIFLNKQEAEKALLERGRL